MIEGKAIILSAGLLSSTYAKTSHGLVRGSDRFDILGVIDPKHAGEDAGEVLDGKKRNLPIYATVKDFLNTKNTADYAIIGIASKGGKVPELMFPYIENCLKAGISIINGLHQHIASIPKFVDLALENNATLVDIRQPKVFGEARFWTGDIIEVQCPKLAVLGTDCALGKRTTTRFVTEHLKKENIKAEMIYTGQTGWMQGSRYGFIFDATLNDFISGEIEGAVLDCYRKENPDIIIIEGQSSLRNPSGPCGSEFIISARLDGVILQHNPKRKKYKDMDHYPANIIEPSEEIDLIEKLGAPVIALSLNTEDLTEEEARKFQKKYEEELNIPVCLPLFDGVEKIANVCKKMISAQ